MQKKQRKIAAKSAKKEGETLAEKQKICYTVSVSWKNIDFRKYKGKCICVACSGGADSVCLLHYMKEREEADGFTLCAVHCEHGIRGENSRADAKFVADFCKKNRIPLFNFSENCPDLAAKEKISLETAAREFRRQSFAALLKDGKADLIATAHHADDEAETVLFHLLRGASLTGAGGMKEEIDRIIRPLLNVTKAEILDYIREHRLTYRTDETNFEADVSRNKLRLKALPLLETIVPGSAENLARFSRTARKDDEFLYRLSEKLLTSEKDPQGVVRRVFVQYSEEEPLFFRACVTAMKTLGVTKDYTYAHLSALRSLFTSAGAQTGKEISLPCGVRAKRRYDRLAFYLSEANKNGSAESAKSAQNVEKFRLGETDFLGKKILITEDKAAAENFSEKHGGAKILYADEEKTARCVLRLRRAGDMIEKFGGGRKALKKYLTDKKIPAEEGAMLPLFCEGNDVKIICGTEISESVKVTENTKKIVYVVSCAAE